MAIRASRLMAMRDLAEKIHGMNIDAYSSLAETTMLADSTRATVQGLVRGARVVQGARGEGAVHGLLERRAARVRGRAVDRRRPRRPPRQGHARAPHAHAHGDAL